MRLAFILVLMMYTCPLFSQSGIGSWVTYTGMNAVTSVSLRNGSLAAATSGGLFIYDTAAQQFSRFNRSHGITSNDLLSIYLAPDQSVWTGASNGSMNRMFPTAASPVQILGIQEKSSARPAVRQFVPTGDSLLVAWESGVSVFLVTKNQFADTYANFGFSSQPIISSVATRPGRIWVGTDKGIVTAVLGSANLIDPASWSVVSSLATLSLAVSGDSVFAGTPAGLYAGTWRGPLGPVAGFAGRTVPALVSDNATVYCLSSSGTTFWVDGWNTATRTISPVVSGTQDVATAMDVKNGVVAVGTAEGGVLWGRSGSIRRLIPPGPASNRFLGLAVDGRGVLWAASGAANGKGLYAFDPSSSGNTQWKNFQVKDFPVMGSNDYFHVALGPNNRIWAGSWGSGIIEIAGDTVRRRIDATTVPAISGTNVGSSNLNYPVVGLAAADADGSILIPVADPVNGNVMTRLSGDTTTENIRCAFTADEAKFFTGVVIDRNRTKWIVNSEPTYRHGLGLLYYNETITLPGTTGGWGLLTASDILPSPNILSVAEGFDGEIWVGTFAGAVILNDALRPTSKYTGVFTLKDRMVQAIAVDGLNNKWVGTKDGVFVFNADATQLLHEYTVVTTGGQLADNDVRALAIDQTRGIVYCGTEKGLSALRIAAIKPQAEYSEMLVAPNPYVIPSNDPVEFRNLVANSSIKVMSSGGHVVTEFKAQGGGRALWDGRDDRGAFVGSGVYFVVAFAGNGNQVVTGKVAVVRR